MCIYIHEQTNKRILAIPGRLEQETGDCNMLPVVSLEVMPVRPDATGRNTQAAPIPRMVLACHVANPLQRICAGIFRTC
jgi:hypothetical protein